MHDLDVDTLDAAKPEGCPDEVCYECLCMVTNPDGTIHPCPFFSHCEHESHR